eukprot:9564471-Alexandrium_andersonii.AAC.1
MDQDPNYQTYYEAILTARLAYVGRVIQAGCTYMGLGPAGLTLVDGPILVAHLLRRPARDLHSMATGPVALAKYMVWAMLEETWKTEDGEAVSYTHLRAHETSAHL